MRSHQLHASCSSCSLLFRCHPHGFFPALALISSLPPSRLLHLSSSYPFFSLFVLTESHFLPYANYYLVIGALRELPYNSDKNIARPCKSHSCPFSFHYIPSGLLFLQSTLFFFFLLLPGFSFDVLPSSFISVQITGRLKHLL